MAHLASLSVKQEWFYPKKYIVKRPCWVVSQRRAMKYLTAFLYCAVYQGSKLKKSSGRLLATNWRNIVARCKFLVASSYNVNDAAHSQGFWYFAPSQSREIHKNTQNTANFGRNLIKYMSVQHIWNFSQLLGLFTCRKLVNLSWNFVTETCKQRPVPPKLPGVIMLLKTGH